MCRRVCVCKSFIPDSFLAANLKPKKLTKVDMVVAIAAPVGPLIPTKERTPFFGINKKFKRRKKWY